MLDNWDPSELSELDRQNIRPIQSDLKTLLASSTR